MGFGTSSSSTAYSPPLAIAPSRTRHGQSLGSLNVPKQRRSRSTRAVTLGTSRQKPSTHSVPYLAQPGSFNTRNHSNPLTQGEANSGPDLQHSLDLEANYSIRREPSFKHRILSRVMSSLISKPGSRQLSTEVFPRSNAVIQPTTNTRASISTVHTGTSIDSDFETALSAFPEPPVSNLKSPTMSSSLDHAQPNAETYRTLCAPAEIAVVRPQVTIIPEMVTLNSNTSQSMHVAVQIGAVTEATTKVPCERNYGLDVAVVIDNS